jgi:hypothetical protein
MTWLKVANKGSKDTQVGFDGFGAVVANLHLLFKDFKQAWGRFLCGI